MAFIDKFKKKNSFKDSKRNFKYLENLIKYSEGEIVLDSDIIIDDDESSDFKRGIKIEKDIVIDGNGYAIDVRRKARIFDAEKSVILKNITLKNGDDLYGGGAAIRTNHYLKVENATFINNKSGDPGGAIRSSSRSEKLEVISSIFKDNHGFSGGAIYGSDNSIEITDTIFENNDAYHGGAVSSTSSEKTIIKDSSFISNNAKEYGGAIRTGNGEFEIINSSFKDNHADDGGWDIYNMSTDLKISNVQFSSTKEKSICGENLDKIEIDSDSFSQLNDVLEEINNSKRNFTYLKNLIEYSEGEIVLDSDIVIDNDEVSEFKEGIKIEKEIIIDGNGYSIDARKKRRIFHVDKPLILKNITLKNGREISFGGAIYNNTDLKLENVTLLNCSVTNWGGAIHSGGVNAKLEIISSRFENNSADGGGALQVSSGALIITDTIFENNSAYNGGAISPGSCEKILIKDSSFISNIAKNNGGAIYTSYVETIIKNCKFSNNDAKKGGALNNVGKLKLYDSNFYKNTAKEEGGAVYNQNEGYINFNNCYFEDNDAVDEGASILNHEGKIIIEECDFSNHQSTLNIISNNESIELRNSIFKNNNVKSVIANIEKGDLTISESDFSNNNVEESTINNVGRECILSNSSFENNVSLKEYSNNIYNESYLKIIKSKFKNEGIAILNKGEIYLKNVSEYFDEYIHNEGKINTNLASSERFDFSYLDALIHNADTNEIVLAHDISIEDYERDFYEGGIELDIDNLVIDGNGKIIDGNNKSRIFIITSKNITLKNIVFKNGFIQKNYDNELNGGGGIHINRYANLSIENCSFDGCVSEKNGGSINNYGRLSLENTEFINNEALKYGGAIYNHESAESNIKNSTFSNNCSGKGGGGAIGNFNKLTLNDILFEKNNSESIGGAISNQIGEISINNVKFIDNSSQSKGGAISNEKDGKIFLNNIEFKNNSSSSGGAIINTSCPLNIESAEFINNNANTGGAINTYNSKVTIKESLLTGNTAKSDGGAIYNYGGNEIIINNSKFNNNESNKEGGAIYNSQGRIKLTKSEFNSNKSNNKGGAIQNMSTLILNNTSFTNNSSKDGGSIYNIRYRIGKSPLAPPEMVGRVNMNNVIFENNKSDNKGGAIYNEKTGILSGKDITFKNNKDNEYNDIWFESENDLDLTNSNHKKGSIFSSGNDSNKDSKIKNIFGRFKRK